MAITLRSGRELEEPSVREVPTKYVTKENEIVMERSTKGNKEEKQKMKKKNPLHLTRMK